MIDNFCLNNYLNDFEVLLKSFQSLSHYLSLKKINNNGITFLHPVFSPQ